MGTNTYLLIEWIGIKLILDEPFELPSQFTHERRSRGDLIAIK